MLEEGSLAAQPRALAARLRLVVALRSAVGYALLWLLLVVFVYELVLYVVDNGRNGSDFTQMWDSGRAILHGVSPYPAVDSLPRVADRAFSRDYTPFYYPAPTAFAMVPFALLPFPLASVLFLGLNLSAVVLAFRLLGVVDWRCYLFAFLSAPVFQACGIATLSPLLLLGVAAAWRYRNRALILGTVVAAVFLAKLFLWPLFVWLARTRRFRAAAVGLALGAAAAIASWALIGFGSLLEYPHLLSRLTQLFGPKGYSLFALERGLGMPGQPAELAQLAVGVVALLIACFFVPSSRTNSDRRLLTATLGVSLLATPILWPHYLILLFAPIALARPRLSPLWLTPLLFWVDTAPWSGGRVQWIVPVQLLSALIVGRALQRRVIRAQTSHAGVTGELLLVRSLPQN